jgi:hypothetical protein
MQILSGGHQGVSAAMKLAFDHSSGPLAGVVHADDIHLPNKVQLQVEALLADPESSLVHTEFRYNFRITVQRVLWIFAAN